MAVRPGSFSGGIFLGATSCGGAQQVAIAWHIAATGHVAGPVPGFAGDAAASEPTIPRSVGGRGYGGPSSIISAAVVAGQAARFGEIGWRR